MLHINYLLIRLNYIIYVKISFESNIWLIKNKWTSKINYCINLIRMLNLLNKNIYYCYE